MSIPISLGELPEVAARYGATPYLLTVGRDAVPHAASVAVAWTDGRLVAGAGRHSAANIQENDQVALLWPPIEPGGHSLIVDGWGDLRPSRSGLEVVIQPSRAVLHVT